jgi:hypothetical protein
MPLKEAALAKPVEPLQIVVPSDFIGLRSNPDATQLYITTEFHTYTPDEIDLIQEYLTKLPYPQSLRVGAIFLDTDDPLLEMDHGQLDDLEAKVRLPNTRKAPSGGDRGTYERVLILREHGYLGTGANALPVGV